MRICSQRTKTEQLHVYLCSDLLDPKITPCDFNDSGRFTGRRQAPEWLSSLSLSNPKTENLKDMIVYGFSKMVYQRIYVLLDPKVLPQLPVTLAAQKDLPTFLTTAISTSLFNQNR
jgi:hypothetical protein